MLATASRTGGHFTARRLLHKSCWYCVMWGRSPFHSFPVAGPFSCRNDDLSDSAHWAANTLIQLGKQEYLGVAPIGPSNSNFEVQRPTKAILGLRVTKLLLSFASKENYGIKRELWRWGRPHSGAIR